MATIIQAGSSKFTLGGLVAVDGEMLGLAVAQAFEGQSPLYLYNTF
jgi:hypothetical protein